MNYLFPWVGAMTNKNYYDDRQIDNDQLTGYIRYSITGDKLIADATMTDKSINSKFRY